jgi:hypothetical protein
LEDRLLDSLAHFPVVLLIGARQVGGFQEVMRQHVSRRSAL